MKKIILFLTIFGCFGIAMAQDSQTCPCLIDDDIEALYAMAMQMEYNTPNPDQSPKIKAAEALTQIGLAVYNACPDASYVLKVTSGGETKYGKISSCQMALEKTYDLLRKGVDEVRIISENLTMNGSCRNRTYTKNDLDEVKRRRDGWSGGF